MAPNNTTQKGKKNKVKGKKRNPFDRTRSGTRGQTQYALAHMSTQNKNHARKVHRARRKASQGRIKARREKYRNMRPLSSKAFFRCLPSMQVLGSGKVGNVKDRSWICSVLGQIQFREQNYPVREAEFRIFIEGAEVTRHVRGTVTWSLQSTGGMNTCSFTLNNNNDTFILTPANICAGTKKSGWEDNEGIKYSIFKRKWKRIRPKTRGEQIDRDTGTWLYPLDPWKPIISKHDAVRVFIRLPHISGICRTGATGACLPSTNKKSRSAEAWTFAFSGFVDEVDWEDQPVEGDRILNVRCYDYRGLLDRMRVRMQANPTSSEATDDTQSAPFDAQNKEAKRNTPKGKNAQTFLKLTKDLCIDRDINRAYKAGFERLYVMNCQKKIGSSNYAECTKKAYKLAQTTYAAQLAILRETWGRPSVTIDGVTIKGKNLAGMIEAANKLDGLKRKLTRNCKSQTPEKEIVKLTYTGTDADGAVKAANAAAAWLKTVGAMVERYAVKYAVTYRDLSTSHVKAYRSTIKVQRLGTLSEIVDKAGKGAYTNDVAIKLLNSITREDFERTPANMRVQGVAMISEIDADLRKESYGKEVIEGIGLNDRTSNTLMRTQAIHQYILKKVIGFFFGVTDKVKRTIDLLVKDETGGRHLFARRTYHVKTAGDALVPLQTTATVVFATAVEGGSGAGAASTSIMVRNAFIKFSSNPSITDKNSRDALSKAVDTFNGALLELLKKLHEEEIKAQQAIDQQQSARGRGRASAVRKTYETTRASSSRATDKNRNKDPNSLADLVTTDAHFNEVTAGMFADLVPVMNKGKHPLENMSFEEAVQFLTLTNTPLFMGIEQNLGKYTRASLEKWNMLALFGIVQRPLTYGEVTEIGEGSYMDLDNTKAPFSPLHGFVHLLLPQDGTGAQTIVQADMTHLQATDRDYRFETRLALLNDINQRLDYKFYCSPAGDLIFEFPNYNALPFDYGRTFQYAYTVVKGLRSFRCTEETGELNTAWVLTGTEPQRLYDDITANHIIKNKFGKIVIIANILARRIGVKKRDVKVELPGVGAVLGNGKSANIPLSTLVAYGLLEIQRELGRMSRISMEYDFRPYMLPNRPIHVPHRQRLALTKSVQYSMTIAHECNVSAELEYVRSLQRNGQFQHIMGGSRMPVDYAGIFSGNVQHTIQYGKSAGNVGRAESVAMRDMINKMSGNRTPRTAASINCTSYMQDRWIEASSFYNDQANATFRKAAKYSAQTSGSDGEAGTMPPTPRGQHSYIATRHRKPASSTGQATDAYSMQGTAMSRSDGDPKAKKTTTSANLYQGKFYNPWPFGLYTKSTFNNWGFIRMIGEDDKPYGARTQAVTSGQSYYVGKGKKRRKVITYRRKHRGNAMGWHNGMDFNGLRERTLAYAPIKFYFVTAHVRPGYGAYPNSDKFYKWIPGPPNFNDVPKHIRLFIVDKGDGDKYAVSRPLPSGGYRRPDNWMELVAKSMESSGISEKEAIAMLPKIPLRVEWKVDAQAMRLYQKAKGNLEVVRGAGNSTTQGIVVKGQGYATLPGSSAEKVACELRYIHCAGLVERKSLSQHKNSGAVGLVGDYRGRKGHREDREVEAEQPVAYVGRTGTNDVHLHLAMYVYPPGAEPAALKRNGDGTSTSAWKAVSKANADFLRTQMKIRLTAGNGLNSGKMHRSWQNYFKRANEKGYTNITTVDEATDFMLSKSARFHNATRLDSKKKISTNPAFFFKPEQIIRDLKDKYAKYAERFGDRRYEAKGTPNVCKKNTEVVKDKISLAYAACQGRAKKVRSNRTKYRQQIADCKKTKLIAENKLKGGVKLKQRRPTTSTGSQTASRLDARVQDSMEATRPDQRHA